MPVDALIEFRLEVLAHNPAELHEDLKNTENNKNLNLDQLNYTRQLSHLRSSAVLKNIHECPFYTI